MTYFAEADSHGRTSISDQSQILALAERAKADGEAVYMATVVHVEGSAYRKAGARMLVTARGERAGSISGGCLEAEVGRKISWLTNAGPTVQRYNSSLDDDNEGVPYGLGCGGTIWILLESEETARPVLEAMRRALEDRVASVAVLGLQRSQCGTRAVFPVGAASGPGNLKREGGTPAETGVLPKYLHCLIAPPPTLTIFGAGDDAKPLVRFAVELDWRVIVADGRSHLLRAERFPQAAALKLLQYDLPKGAACERWPSLQTSSLLGPEDFAVLLTHSYNQDRALLRVLLPVQLRYLGILGPLHRTRRLIGEVAPMIDLSAEDCLSKLHAPVGLNLGPGDATVVALSVIAELQAVLSGSLGICNEEA